MSDAPASATSLPAYVSMSGITKKFGEVTACEDVNLTLWRGRIHGLLGENGAGKSTLMKILLGLHLPDAGSISIDSKPCRILSPADARKLDIAMVHQHFSLVPALTVWENVQLGDTGKLNKKATCRQIAEISEHYKLDVDPHAKVGDLSVGVRQRVEIIKCLRHNPRIIILDEPTSVLDPAESEQLFAVLRQVAGTQGRCVALISHKLDEILAITDDVSIMREGRVVAQMPTSEADAPTLARAMLGQNKTTTRGMPVRKTEPSAPNSATSDSKMPDSRTPDRVEPPTLRISNIQATAGKSSQKLLDSLSLEAWPGEIVGIAGVEGSGQTALEHLLSGLLKTDSGTVEVDGKAIPTGKPGVFNQAGVAVIASDRHSTGCILDMSVAQNLCLSHPQDMLRHGMLSRSQIQANARHLMKEFSIDATSPNAPMWSLSGGNQQRVVLARELSRKPRVLLASQPTRGLDIGAVEYLMGRLRQTATDGVAVILASRELEELLEFADRILVLSAGRIIGEVAANTSENTAKSENTTTANLEKLGMLLASAGDNSSNNSTSKRTDKPSKP